MAKIPLGIESDAPGSYQTRLNKREKKVVEAAREDTNIEETFDSPMVMSSCLDTGLQTDTALAALDVFSMQSRSAHYTVNVQSVNGTVINTAPTVIATGLELEVAAATNSVLGWEISPGTTFTSSYAGQTIGSFAEAKDVFFEVATTITTAANSEEYIVGWRKSAPAIAEFDDYLDFAALRVDASADIQIETILNNAGATTDDTLINMTGGVQFTLRVEVSNAGLARFFVDGVEKTSLAAGFNFDSGDVIIPFIHLITTADPVCVVNSLKCGIK